MKYRMRQILVTIKDYTEEPFADIDIEMFQRKLKVMLQEYSVKVTNVEVKDVPIEVRPTQS